VDSVSGKILLSQKEIQEKRVFKRIPTFLSTKLFYNFLFYDARIINISQNGIYFLTDAYASFGLNIEISIPLESTEFKVPFKIVRISKTSMPYSGFGAELLSPSKEYTKFIHGRITSM
jgi:hypothetical protein